MKQGKNFLNTNLVHYIDVNEKVKLYRKLIKGMNNANTKNSTLII